MELGVNIDHVATLRNARGEIFPSPVHAAFVVLEAGASNVTCHLREDRRHIKDEDVRIISDLTKKLNLEMSADEGIVKIAMDIMPRSVTIVPERRKELTTEGGLDAISNVGRFRDINSEFKSIGCTTSAFIEPDLKQIEAAAEAEFDFIEIHTGSYAGKTGIKDKAIELKRIKEAARHAVKIGLKINAGHGLNYKNVYDIVMIDGFYEFNIGFSIISRSIFTGLESAVKEMLGIIKAAELAKV
ncbi:pyridoxine 5'-phosphate synthase [Candidatus Acidulodesulfobacterium sp. H_13]|uniref:pyridoxine 5'-phosphate synthase n=1 Tax=Candidatus Acidulodesulfobacterium sp. H_13 TaxID=3395470 RepID=UPI003AF6BED5